MLGGVASAGCASARVPLLFGRELHAAGAAMPPARHRAAAHRRVPRVAEAGPLRPQGRDSAADPRAGHRQGARRGRRGDRRAARVLQDRIRVRASPRPRRCPASSRSPLEPPCEPLTGDSHAHLLAPLRRSPSRSGTR